MKHMNNKVLMVVAAMSTLFASFAASSACIWTLYQPTEPKSLREK